MGGTDRVFDYGADDKPRVGASSDSLQQLTYLAQKQERLEDEVAQLEQQLKAKQAELRDVAERQIPELMIACRIKKQEFRDGTKLVLDTKLKAALYEESEKRAEQIAWLDSHGLSAIVKRKLGLRFDREDVDSMDLVLAGIARDFPRVEATKSFDVHNSTLVASLSEMLRTGQDFPMKLFQAFEIRRAKLSRPK